MIMLATYLGQFYVLWNACNNRFSSQDKHILLKSILDNQKIFKSTKLT